MKRANPFSVLTDRELDPLVERLRAALRPVAIYLFGSHAVGVPKPGSDIDLFVVIEDEPVTIEHYKLGRACLRGSGQPVEIHLCSRHRFERYNGVVGSLQHDVKGKGLLLYAAEA